MDTLDFLRRVLPSSGYYVSALVNDGRASHGFFKTVEDLANSVISINERGGNVYYAVSSYATKTRRIQDNVKETKLIALDIDCGEEKAYASQRDALTALLGFIQKLAAPEPMVVSSGNGLHAYWVLDKALAPAEWQPLAEAVKAAALDNGLLIDPTVTADSARILRAVGTINVKGGKEAKLLIDRQPVAPEELKQVFHKYIIAESRAVQAATSSLLQNLAVQTEYAPAVASAVYNKCQQVRWLVDNQADKEKVTEPRWYSLLGVAAYCHDAEDTAINWSKDHPDFDANATLQKMYHWRDAATGPTTCKRFMTERPRGCDGCKVKDLIKSPIRLGAQYKEIDAPHEAPDKIAAEIDIPKPFKRTAAGIKLTIDETDIDVCSFDIYPVGYGRDESLGYETVRFHWNRKHVGWQELSFRQGLLTTAKVKDFTMVIADQGIVLATEKQTEYFQIMLRSYMDALREKRAMTNLYASMGWKDDFKQFVIGNTLLRRNNDGTVSNEDISLATTSQRIGSDFYDTAGSLESWVQFTSILEKAHLPWHMFALTAGMSSVFYAFTGLKGLTISLYGPTGGGKTLVQYWIQSLFGNPDKLHFAAKFTQNTLFGRMGTYAHMPMTIDEVTLMNDKDVGDFIYWVSQGRDKARMTRAAEEREAKSWAMPVFVSTNRSFNSKMIASGLDTEAQMMRLLELTVPAHPMFTKNSEAGRKIYQFLMGNYGTVGREFVRRLLEIGEAGVKAMIAEATEEFASKYNVKFSGEERYWEQAMVLADLTAKLMFEWEMIKFNPRTGIEWALAQVGVLRTNISENSVDSFDILAEFTNEHASSVITVMHTGSQKPMLDINHMPRGEIRGRYDIYRNSSNDKFDRGTLLIDRAFFRKWLSSKGVDYKGFLEYLESEQAVVTPKSQKAYLGKNTPIRLGQSYVFGVNCRHPRMIGVFDEADAAVENLMVGQLQAL